MGPQYGTHNAVQSLEFLFSTKFVSQHMASVAELIEPILPSSPENLVEPRLKCFLGKHAFAHTPASSQVLQQPARLAGQE